MAKKQILPLLIAAAIGVSCLTSCKESATPASSGGGSQTPGTSSTASSEKKETFTVTYEGGEGASGVVPSKKGIESGESVTLSDNAFKKEDHLFTGWSDGTNVYKPGDKLTVTGNVTLTAQWENEWPPLKWMTNCDSLDTGWEGFPPMTLGKSTTPREGSGYFEITETGDPTTWGSIVFRNEITIMIKLQSYLEKGSVHISVYVHDNPENIVGGQIEFTSSGTGDQNELSYGEFGSNIKLKKGWNDLEIPFSAFKEVGGKPDYNAINYIRVYFNIIGKTTIGIDNFYITNGAES